YIGRYEGSFARGLPFQENPDTGDARISGTLASLAGLEQALLRGDEQLIALAVRRILMLHSIILSIGGLPLLYLGDEWGTLNDYAYVREPAQAGDSRWVHRPHADWDRRAALRQESAGPFTQIFTGLSRLIQLRKAQPALWDGEMEVIETDSPHL